MVGAGDFLRIYHFLDCCCGGVPVLEVSEWHLEEPTGGLEYLNNLGQRKKRLNTNGHANPAFINTTKLSI